MHSHPIFLVPGFWLGAWAWDDVAADLRRQGHTVTALTLPGLSSPDEARANVSFEDHVHAVTEAVMAAGQRVVLAVHSGTGGVGYAVSDRVPDRIAAMVYVDSGPATGPLDPDFAGVELPFPGIEALAQTENLDGVSDAQRALFEARAVPEPGDALRSGPALTCAARRDVPTVMIATSWSPDQVRDAVAQGHGFVAGLTELHDVTYVHLPTSHWPMWSEPSKLARILADVATT